MFIRIYQFLREADKARKSAHDLEPTGIHATLYGEWQSRDSSNIYNFEQKEIRRFTSQKAVVDIDGQRVDVAPLDNGKIQLEFVFD